MLKKTFIIFFVAGAVLGVLVPHTPFVHAQDDGDEFSINEFFDDFVDGVSGVFDINFGPLETFSEMLTIIGSVGDIAELLSSGRARQPFGGKVTQITRCTCSIGWRLKIGPPTDDYFLYVDGTQNYREFNLPAFVWTLGLYVPGGVCLVKDGDDCDVLRVRGIITPTVGSSF